MQVAKLGRARNVQEKLVRLVQATYRKKRTVVRTPNGQTEEFKINVGLHQRSALSTFLFVIVLDVISEMWRDRGNFIGRYNIADMQLITESEAGICWKEVSKSIANRSKSLLAAKKRQKRVIGTMAVTLS